MKTIDYRSLANPALHGLTPYQPGKPLAELERELGITSAIKLASNENPLGASPQALAAAKAALAATHIYPDGGCYELKQALAAYLGVETSQLTIGNGSENILELIVKAYLHRNDNAVISEFAFLTIPLLLQSYGVTANVAKAVNWSHDVDHLLAAINEKTRVLFVVNPNNPTGTYINQSQFERLLENIPSHIIIVIDEAYVEYISNPDFPKTLSYLTQYPNLIITRTFSKAFGLAALRLGFAISSPEIADMLNRARLPFNVNHIAASAACAALSDQVHLQKSIELNLLGMQQMTTALHELQIPFIPSLGNFITMQVHDAKTVYENLLLKGVIVRPLHAYRMPQHIRVTIGLPAENARFLAAIQEVMLAQQLENIR
jgi:histidinol-phosphate aminotransferase